MDIEHVLRVADLNGRYADAIDSDRLEAWPDFFLDDGRYRITTAENLAQGFPVSIIYAASRAMMRDRVRALREANVYEEQRYRHILGAPLITPPAHAGEGREGEGKGREEAGAALRARTSFMVARVMRTGETIIFATGCYDDRIVFGGSGEAHFVEKTVIIDSRQIDTLLAIPL